MESTLEANRTSKVNLAKWPWWAIALILTGLLLTYSIFASETYRSTFTYLSDGIVVTLRITIFSYLLATVIGLFVGLARVSKNVVIYNLSTLYVEAVRGVPMVVLILYFAFALMPVLVEWLRSFGEWWLSWAAGTVFANLFAGLADPLLIRKVPNEMRAIIALAIGYGAFEAEVFRAGIQSIGKGQMEAARSLGMGYIQAMRFVILPQAIRRVLPPLGNDFIALLKDSALVTVLAINDITQLGRLRRASTFRVLETFNVVAFLYLSMTLLLSAGVRVLEQKMRIED